MVEQRNLDDVFEFPRLAEELGISNIRIGMVQAIGKGKGIDLSEDYLIKLKEICEQYSSRMNIYLPLEETMLSAYMEGYLTLEPDGSVFRNNVQKQNFLDHINSVNLLEEKWKKIYLAQINLFVRNMEI